MTTSHIHRFDRRDRLKSLVFGLSVLTAGLAVCFAGGCDAGDDADDGGASSAGGKADEADGVAGELAELDDPIAVFLRDVVDTEGDFEIEYLDMLVKIAEQQGCNESTIDSYVISDELIGGNVFPRVVNTVCSDDRSKADLAFFALSFADGDDVDTRTLEMFGWDATNREYVFYKTTPRGKAGMRLEISPAECSECHLGPTSLAEQDGIHMLPIMNELQAPWEHWHATPQSVNHEVPEATQKAPKFAELAGKDSKFLSSAAQLEQTIRNAFSQRVVPARVRARRTRPADPNEAMDLLRPLFCDEQLTYVTEDGSSGLLPSSAVVDDGFHSAYFAIMGTGWPWEWWNDRSLRLSPAGAPDPVNMMPVRGAAVVAYEKQLIQTRAVTPQQVLSVRGLDWHVPVLSEFRCALYEQAAERVAKNPPEVEKEDPRNADLFPALLAEILTLVPADHGLSGDPVALTSPEDGKFLIVDEASTAVLDALLTALSEGTIVTADCETDGFCLLDQMELGAHIETRFKALEAGSREPLHELRNDRACVVQRDFPNQPFIPDADCG